MDNNLRVTGTCGVQLASNHFLVEEWPLAYTNTNVHLRRAHVVQALTHESLVLVNHQVEVDISRALAGSLQLRLPDNLGLLLLFHGGATGLALLLNFLDAFH